MPVWNSSISYTFHLFNIFYAALIFFQTLKQKIVEYEYLIQKPIIIS